MYYRQEGEALPLEIQTTMDQVYLNSAADLLNDGEIPQGGHRNKAQESNHFAMPSMLRTTFSLR